MKMNKREGNNLIRIFMEEKNKYKYHKDWNKLIPVLDKIEELDMREYHYKWEMEGRMRSNFKRFEIDIGYRNCLIWMELELDPMEIVAGGFRKEYNTRIKAVWKSVIEFIEYYNLVTKKK